MEDVDTFVLQIFLYLEVLFDQDMSAENETEGTFFTGCHALEIMIR